MKIVPVPLRAFICLKGVAPHFTVVGGENSPHNNPHTRRSWSLPRGLAWPKPAINTDKMPRTNA